MKKIILGILTIIVVSSCSEKKLTNEEALVILNNNYSDVCIGTIKGKAWNDGGKGGRTLDGENLFKVAENLERKGLLNIRNASFGDKYLKSTQKAKNEYGKDGKLILSKAKVVSIDGISQKEGTALINFTVEYEDTPFYKLRYKNFCNKESKKSIELLKFDTGWAIKK